MGYITQTLVESSQPPELKTKVLVQITVHLGWSPLRFLTVECPFTIKAMKLVLFILSHCTDEETEAQSNSLIWPKIIQLLTANILEPAPNLLAIPYTTHGCRETSLYHLDTQLIMIHISFTNVFLSYKIKKSLY